MNLKYYNLTVARLTDTPDVYRVFIAHPRYSDDIDVLGAFSTRQEAEKAIDIIKRHGGTKYTYTGGYIDMDTGRRYTAFDIMQEAEKLPEYSGMSPDDIIQPLLVQNGGTLQYCPD